MDDVVLLHGLGRTHLSLLLPRMRLRSRGFRPVNIRYPSRALPIEELARFVENRLPRETDRRVHFLTHSLGGILVRYMLGRKRPANLGRVVMLAPPNQGSQLAGRMKQNPLWLRAAGPTARQLGADADSVPKQLGPVDFELGVIAGNRPLSPLAHLIDGENDGIVAVDEARVEGMADFLVVPRGHTFIMNDRAVLDQAIHFFRHGAFAR